MRHPFRAFVVTAALCLFIAAWPAVTPAAAAAKEKAALTLEQADELLRAKEWPRAAAAYETIVRREPDNGQAWVGLGHARLSLKEFDAAVAAYERAAALKVAPPRPQYNLACVHALRGDREQAFAWLDKALAAGFQDPKLLETDEDLQSLRDDPRFATAVETAGRRAFPCRYDATYAQFDFWVGDWEVRVPQGGIAGTNRIHKELENCLLVENWTSAGGNTGRSMNYLDPMTKKWTQIWVASGGDVISLVGEFRDGAMRFEGEHIERSGSKVRSRMSLTPLANGHVRQFIEESKDGGATWSVSFEGDYASKK